MRRFSYTSWERSLWPRRHQQVVLRFFDLRLPGVIESMVHDVVEFRAATPAALLVLKPQARVTTTYTLAPGVVDARFAVLGTQGPLLRLQALGSPTVAQRRHHPRIKAHVPTRLIWRSAGGDLAEADARTLDLSLGGARVRFDAAPAAPPPERATALFELGLPTGTVPAVARFVQVWQDGARVRFGDVDPADGRRLTDFIDDALV